MMSPRTLDQMLGELGKARSAGLFDSAGSGEFPWARPAATIRTLPRTRSRVWGIAAAAVVALSLVGSWQLERLWSQPASPVAPAGIEFARNDAATKPDAAADKAKIDPSNMDFNADGVVDGDDIQAFVSKGGANSRDASELANRLLGR